MMWFKRFCDGHAITFDFIVDLDKSVRNRVSSSIQALLFGDRLSPPDIDAKTVPLTQFFVDVVEKSEKHKDEDIVVYAGDYKDPLNPGLWRFHEFQLHCLRNGFLSDTYPYWAVGLEEWTSQGAINLNDGQRRKDSETCLVHMRIGDCATLLSQEVEKDLDFVIPNYALSGGRLFSRTEFSLYKMGLLRDVPQRHYAERGARIVEPSVMANSVLNSKASGKEHDIVFATDGFTRAAQALSHQMDESAEGIEERLSGLLHPLTDLADRSMVGEDGALLHEVLVEIAKSKWLISTSSLFPITVKCALEGEPAKRSWTIVDQMDDLSKYLQLPSLVDHPREVLEARLEQLAIEEPVLGQTA
jgi:hypothetical protein